MENGLRIMSELRSDDLAKRHGGASVEFRQRCFIEADFLSEERINELFALMLQRYPELNEDYLINESTGEIKRLREA